MADPRLLAQLPHTLRETALPSLGSLYRGKVRDVYERGDTLFLVTTDRLSAFDRVLTTIPFKGELLNRIAAFWFEKTRHVLPSHLLEVPDPNVLVARKCEAYAIEVVVRGYLTGSLWREYERGARALYGLTLPDGLRRDQRFETPIITPSTKAALGAHDEPISEAELLARRLASPREWAQMKEAALGLFEVGQSLSAEQGLLLVDTKYEFGRADGKLLVIDEIHTPDSSRYWLSEDSAARFEAGQPQRMLDKENIRQWLLNERGFSGHGEPPEIPDALRVDLAEKYVTAFERITGARFDFPVGDALERLTQNLRARGYLAGA